MAQQTAVDLFMAYVSKHKEFLGYDLDEVYKQAKAIEKEQIINAWRNGDNDSMYEPKQLDEQAEQYYKETYKK